MRDGLRAPRPSSARAGLDRLGTPQPNEIDGDERSSPGRRDDRGWKRSTAVAGIVVLRRGQRYRHSAEKGHIHSQNTTTAEFCPNRDEDIDYALRLLRAGVPVELHQWPGTFHGSQAIQSAQVS
ncbi:alpha/beta hydrolase fold domain-containing protein, partial [Nocardia asiatica]|uniref:alpha/beta hydrolase fold domain-containing protein n=1 Tax=Nocardia asiatica TaxID=209252 RepID=UPI003CC7E7D7